MLSSFHTLAWTHNKALLSSYSEYIFNHRDAHYAITVNHTILKSTLRKDNVTLQDAGNYSCVQHLSAEKSEITSYQVYIQGNDYPSVTSFSGYMTLEITCATLDLHISHSTNCISTKLLLPP